MTQIIQKIKVYFLGEIKDTEVEHENIPDIYTEGFAHWKNYITQAY